MLFYSGINPSKALGIKRKEGETLKISTKGRYGLRILLDLALYAKNAPRQMKDIAQSQQISEKYIKHPSEALSVGDIVTVKIKGVDLKKKRISLTMKI